MTQKDLILQAFHIRGGKATLGQLLEDGRYSFAHKLTARLSDLRQEGYKIDCIEGSRPTENLYVLHEPFRFDSAGMGG